MKIDLVPDGHSDSATRIHVAPKNEVFIQDFDSKLRVTNGSHYIEISRTPSGCFMVSAPGLWDGGTSCKPLEVLFPPYEVYLVTDMPKEKSV